MISLDLWLKQATRQLSTESTAQVCREIREHYESAREAAILGGANADEADRAALTALGDAGVANHDYRKVLLTSAEARVLGEGNREARAICARPWLKRLLLSLSAASLVASAALAFAGASDLARILLAGGLVIGFGFATPFLPIYTPERARIVRGVKWVLLAAALAVAFGHEALKYSWLLFSAVWPIFWIEWRRNSIRRKLPVARWPKQLYL